MPRQKLQIQTGNLCRNIEMQIHRELSVPAELSPHVLTVVESVLRPGIFSLSALHPDGLKYVEPKKRRVLLKAMKDGAKAIQNFCEKRPDLFYKIVAHAQRVKDAFDRKEKRPMIERFFHQCNAFTYKRGENGKFTSLLAMRCRYAPNKEMLKATGSRFIWVAEMEDGQLVDFLSRHLNRKVTRSDIAKARLAAHARSR